MIEFRNKYGLIKTFEHLNVNQAMNEVHKLISLEIPIGQTTRTHLLKYLESEPHLIVDSPESRMIFVLREQLYSEKFQTAELCFKLVKVEHISR